MILERIRDLFQNERRISGVMEVYRTQDGDLVKVQEGSALAKFFRQTPLIQRFEIERTERRSSFLRSWIQDYSTTIVKELPIEH